MDAGPFKSLEKIIGSWKLTEKTGQDNGVTDFIGQNGEQFRLILQWIIKEPEMLKDSSFQYDKVN